MITVFDVPKEIRKALSVKKINNFLNLIVGSLEKQELNEEEIKEVISSKSFWIGLLEVSKLAL